MVPSVGQRVLPLVALVLSLKPNARHGCSVRSDSQVPFCVRLPICVFAPVCCPKKRRQMQSARICTICSSATGRPIFALTVSEAFVLEDAVLTGERRAPCDWREAGCR